jgi:WD40 repeat protein
VRVIDKQSDWVQTLDISSDGRWLAAGRYDGTLSLYDAKSYRELRPPMLVFDPRLPPTANQIKEVAGK